MTEWRKSPTVAAVGVALFAILQLAIPISRMGNDGGPQRFGWQMFSTVGKAIEFTVHTATGSVVIDLEYVIAEARGDIPLEELLPPHLCNTVDGAESVTWKDKRFQCWWQAPRRLSPVGLESEMDAGPASAKSRE